MGRLLYSPLKFLVDLLVSLVLWVYFTVGFAIFFLPRYLLGSHEPAVRELRFQRLHQQFFGGFFFLIRTLSPGVRLEVGPGVRELSGAVLVSNHLSLMDPLLVIWLFPRCKTIIKPGWLRVPIFGWFTRGCGYVPAGEGAWTGAEAEQRRARLASYLAGGGNLFIFPEGTRSRDGAVGPFRRGAFVLAQDLGRPLALLRITGSEQLLRRGTFWVNTCARNTVRVELVGLLERNQGEDGETPAALARQARGRYLHGSGA